MRGIFTRHLAKATLFLIFLSSEFTSLAQPSTGRIIQPVARAEVNMKELAVIEAMLPRPLLPIAGPIPNKESITEPTDQIPSPTPPELINPNRIAVASPSDVFNYLAAPDEAQGGGVAGIYTIPPDTYGAVGLDKVFITVNNNYKILDKTTGGQLSLVSMPSFWSSLGANGAGAFDPRVIYDPYNNRWLLAAVANGGAASSRVLVGISQTHDPSGSYWLFAFDPDTGATLWADYPTLGFNKNWVAVSNNLFPVAGGPFNNTKIFVLNYLSLLTGTATATEFTPPVSLSTIHPAETFSSTEETLYMVNHVGSAAATYRFHTITGTPALPVVTFGAVNLVRPGGGWVQPAGNTAPQNCLSSCPAGPPFPRMHVGDARISGNLVFRNGAIWYAQTVGLPAGVMTRLASQWTKLNNLGVVLDGGRIDDATATATNGGHFYIYPSIGINANNDVLVGFSKTESDGFAGAAYAFRNNTDAAGTMQDPIVYKDGEDYYDKKFGGANNRWGDYSHTLVDPLDDASFWTIQEYARPRVPPFTGSSDSRWGTWLAKVAPNANLSSVAPNGNWSAVGSWSAGTVPTASQHVNIMLGDNITLDIDPLAASITVNDGATLTISTNRILSCKLIIYGTLNITGGKLTLGDNNVFLSEFATLAGGSPTSYLVTNGTGAVSKIITAAGSFIFPVSPNTSSYNGLTISNTGGPTEVFTVRVAAGVTPASTQNAAAVQRTWNISEMTSGGNTALLTFRWAAAEHGASFTGSSAFAYRHNGTMYILASSMTAPVLGGGIYTSSTSTGISTFSPWIVAATNTLPIGINYFTGTKLGNDNHLLNWKASCSGTSANFEIQRSGDGQNFTALTSIDADYARCLQPFDFTDAAPLPGKNFYRLRIRDENGKVIYSNIVLLLNSKSGFEIVNLQPNPVTHAAILNLTVANKQNLKLYITDSRGSRVLQTSFDAMTGTNQKDLNLAHLSSGTYMLTIVSDQNEQRTIRFVKQ